MNPYQTILFCTDFSKCANQAFEHAIYMANRYKSHLHLLHIVALHGEEPDHAKKESFVEKAPEPKLLQKWLGEEGLTQLQDADLASCTVVQRRGISVAPLLVDYAEEIGADLIVMATHGRRGLGHLLLGSTTEEVVRLATSPLLTIRARQKPFLPQYINTICVPLDFSKDSVAALQSAAVMAKSYDATLELLHIIETIDYPPLYDEHVESASDRSESISLNAYNELRRLGALHVPEPIDRSYHVVSGYAADEIVTYAKQRKVELIVIAPHGLSQIRRFFLGSVAEKVIRYAPCPVLVMKGNAR